MTYYKVEMQHTDESFEALAHMQYDLFCQKNKITRTILSVVCILAGVLNYESWWGILLVAYGCYLTTSKYSAANHTAHKLSKQINDMGAPYPASRFLFQDDSVEIVSLTTLDAESDNLDYSEIFRLGEDYKYFYIFRNQYGGYMIPKEELSEKQSDFKYFIQAKTGKTFRYRAVPVIRLSGWVADKMNNKGAEK